MSWGQFFLIISVCNFNLQSSLQSFSDQIPKKNICCRRRALWPQMGVNKKLIANNNLQIPWELSIAFWYSDLISFHQKLQTLPCTCSTYKLLGSSQAVLQTKNGLQPASRYKLISQESTKAHSSNLNNASGNPAWSDNLEKVFASLIKPIKY